MSTADKSQAASPIIINIYLNRRNSMEERNSSNGLLPGLLIGAAIGIAVGLLFAPQSGKETRALLKEKAAVAKEKAAIIAQKAKAAAQNLRKNAPAPAAD
jgi:hypothetical protein